MIFTYYPNKESYQPSYFLIWELPQLLTSGTTRESFEGFKSGRITKEQLPIIIASGQVEPGRKTNDNVRYHSGVIMLDLDRKDNPDIENKIRYIIMTGSHIYPSVHQIMVIRSAYTHRLRM